VHAAGPLAESFRSSPEVDGASLVTAISVAQGIPAENISLGAGSSEIIHRVLPNLLGFGRVALLDPCYSEYPSLIGRIGLGTNPVRLSVDSGFQPDFEQLVASCRGATALVLVNPNNPTGVELHGEVIRRLADQRPDLTIWVDETYVDFAPGNTTIEKWAWQSDRVFVLKSLSKAYALSGARVAYLLSPNAYSRSIRAATPPWIVSSVATNAAIAALADQAYYAMKWTQTRDRLSRFASELRRGGLTVHLGHIPAILIGTPEGARRRAAALAAAGVFVRAPDGMGDVLADDWIRVALPRPDQEGIVIQALLQTSVAEPVPSPPSR
jgi:histidinol-phosphate/aromatic aminotransferase/cobyric acid decarboxylase-like protein